MQMSFNQGQLTEKDECSEVWLTPESTGELFGEGVWMRWLGEGREVKQSTQWWSSLLMNQYLFQAKQ